RDPAMFTGIIETMGRVEATDEAGSGRILRVSSLLAPALKPDQSLAHHGVCLTVEAVRDDVHQVTAIAETLARPRLGELRPGDRVNVERCLPLNGRLDGHLVQGHVDALGTCTGLRDLGQSRELQFSYPREYAALLVEKGSVCLNGISLTVFGLDADRFSV